jgi:hypothetical protein
VIDFYFKDALPPVKSSNLILLNALFRGFVSGEIVFLTDDILESQVIQSAVNKFPLTMHRVDSNIF